MQQLKLDNLGRRNALAAICGGQTQVRRMNGNSAAKDEARLYSLQNSNQRSAGLSLGFEGRMVQTGRNFTEIWARF
jgi:hypothetical protein